MMVFWTSAVVALVGFCLGYFIGLFNGAHTENEMSRRRLKYRAAGAVDAFINDEASREAYLEMLEARRKARKRGLSEDEVQEAGKAVAERWFGDAKDSKAR